MPERETSASALAAAAAAAIPIVSGFAIVMAAYIFTTPLPSRADSNTASVSACFTPPPGCSSQIVAAINSAHKEILVQAYEFTAPAILDALVAAKRRGVDVRVILDKVNATSRYSGATFVQHAGIPVWIDSHVAIAHNKIMIIDRSVVVGGSYNYTKSADTRNAENVTFISSPAIAAEFVANWEARQAASAQVP